MSEKKPRARTGYIPEERKCTMTMNWSQAEMDVLEQYAKDGETTKTAILRAALRLYQLVHIRYAEGETMSFSGDRQRTLEFIGPNFPVISRSSND